MDLIAKLNLIEIKDLFRNFKREMNKRFDSIEIEDSIFDQLFISIDKFPFNQMKDSIDHQK